LDFITHFIDLFCLSAPFLLLGYTIAGMINVYLPESWLTRQLGKQSFGHSVKAAFIGAPLPLCSCGVIPTALGLKRRGASNNATAAFLVATPETGVDSVAVSYALLGPVFALFRPIAAIFSAVLAGESVRLLGEKATGTVQVQPSGCCKSHNGRAQNTDKGVKDVLHYGLVKMLADTATWLLIGITFAALVAAHVPEAFFALWGTGILAMLLMVLISIPMYICATASTPVAVGFLLAGMSPGAVLVFMLTGPATNIATLGVIGKEMGKKAVAGYLLGVIAGAIIMGYVLDYLFTQFNWTLILDAGHHHMEQSIIQQLSGIVLALLILYHYTKKGVSVFQSASANTASK